MTNFDKYLSNQPLAEYNIYSSIRSKHGFQSDVDARLHTEYEGEMYMRNRSALLRRILLAGILLCLILAGFCVYLRTTRNMTVERNANYVADAAAQTAKRIDDEVHRIMHEAHERARASLEERRDQLDTMADFYRLLKQMTQLGLIRDMPVTDRGTPRLLLT